MGKKSSKTLAALTQIQYTMASYLLVYPFFSVILLTSLRYAYFMARNDRNETSNKTF